MTLTRIFTRITEGHDMAIIRSISEADRSKRPPAPALPVEFQVKRRLKLWVVLRDDVYTGSYPEEEKAVLAAEREIKAVVKAGGKAHMREEAT